MKTRKETAQAQEKIFSRRVAVIGGIQAFLVSALAGRMYFLQVIEADKYKLLAEENRINRRIVKPLRGLILDRFGVPLATNSPSYRAYLVAEQTPDIDHTLDMFAKLVPFSEKDGAKVKKERGRNRSFVPLAIKDDLTWEQVSSVELNLPDLPGISVDIDQKRDYPYGGITSHILGYVAAVSEKDVKADPDPLLSQPGFRIGRNGLEKQYDLSLRGAAGESQIEVNSIGRVIRELSHNEGTPGRDLVTTLDIGLQEFAHQRLSAELSGALALMDIFSGDLLAIASTPAYDPMAFYRGLSTIEWQTLTADMYNPLTNKAVAGQYAPGSTFKLMTALAALKSGIDPSAHIFCSGVSQVGDALFHCWRKGGHGLMDMSAALKNSCDVYFYEVARRIGIDPIAGMARSFGLGASSNLALPGEKPGLIPDRAWKRDALGDVWHAGETLVNAIGQGFVQATPLQLCVMTARIANGGLAVEPRLVRSLAGLSGQGDDAAEPSPMNINPEWLRIVRTGMDRVTNEEYGTAYRSRIAIPGMEMSGKTGTSQVRRITMAERLRGIVQNEDLPWAQRDHALFVAFAPTHAPRYACAVVIEHGGGGSKIAAPIARDVLTECQRRDPSRRNPNAEGGRREMP